MGRRLRSILPCTTNQLICETVCYRATQARFLKNHVDEKTYFDKSGVRTLQPLKTGETVPVKQEGEWRPAQVVEKADKPRIYVVKTSDGGIYRRNRRDLHKDPSQDQFSQLTDTGMNTKLAQPTSDVQDGLQLSGNLEDQQQKAGNTDITQDGYRTRSRRLVKVRDRY